jgi:hypothetical protein
MSSVKVVSVAAGANHTVAVSETGGLWTCGRGRHGQLGHGHFHDAGPLRRLEALRGMRVTHAVAGGAHSLCLTECGSVWSWGACRHGQLGLGDVAFATAAGWETGVPWPCLVESLQDLDEPVVTLAAGGHHTLFVTAGGQLWGCGRGKHGALGVGVRGGHFDYYYYEEDQSGPVRGPNDHLVPRLIPVHHKPAPKSSVAGRKNDRMRRTLSGSLADAYGTGGPKSSDAHVLRDGFRTRRHSGGLFAVALCRRDAHRDGAQEEAQPQVHARVLRRPFLGFSGRDGFASLRRCTGVGAKPPGFVPQRLGEGAVHVRLDVPRRARGGGREPQRGAHGVRRGDDHWVERVRPTRSRGRAPALRL